ncbi:bcl-2-related ovarian killer protein isoform X1 [Tupaia chinensis]|uniref:bcl-2-related ovarian killer protein isoform X1 n=1 Tax=Tupaia chinensis TaxID=246437 RepID=UPI000FFC6305|nr:bcl-2-related ovarian killer protein isoform X1 [Tupaia chinensis]
MGCGWCTARPKHTHCSCWRPGDELELIRPSVYRDVARQLHIPLQSEPVVTDAFLAVAGHIFSADRRPQVRGQHRPRAPRSLAGGCPLQLWPLPEGRLLRAASRENQVVLQTAAAPDTGGPGAEAGPCSLAPSSGGHLGCLAGAQTFSHTPSSPAARPALCSPTPRVAPDLGVPQGCAWWWVPGRPY